MSCICMCVCVCVCVCMQREGWYRELREPVRSQDGSYLVEFIHRENMLLQVILLMSGARCEWVCPLTTTTTTTTIFLHHPPPLTPTTPTRLVTAFLLKFCKNPSTGSAKKKYKGKKSLQTFTEQVFFFFGVISQEHQKATIGYCLCWPLLCAPAVCFVLTCSTRKREKVSVNKRNVFVFIGPDRRVDLRNPHVPQLVSLRVALVTMSPSSTHVFPFSGHTCDYFKGRRGTQRRLE